MEPPPQSAVPKSPRVPDRHTNMEREMARTDGKLHPRESARPTNCRGSGAFLTCTPRTYCSRKWLPVKAFLPLPLQRSCFELLAVDLPGPTGISPSQSSPIRSRDDPSSRHRISASFRNLLGSRTIIMRSVHRDFQRTNCLFGSAWRRRFRRLPQHGQSGWQLPLLAPDGLHEGVPYGRPRAPSNRPEALTLGVWRLKAHAIVRCRRNRSRGGQGRTTAHQEPGSNAGVLRLARRRPGRTDRCVAPYRVDVGRDC